MCARAHGRVLLGDATACGAVYAGLAPYAGQVALTGHIPPAWGCVDFFLGELAATLGRPADAERHLRAAITINQRLGARRWLARTWSALADLLSRQPGQASQTQAAAARAEAERTGKASGHCGLTTAQR